MTIQGSRSLRQDALSILNVQFSGVRRSVFFRSNSAPYTQKANSLSWFDWPLRGVSIRNWIALFVICGTCQYTQVPTSRMSLLIMQINPLWTKCSILLCAADESNKLSASLWYGLCAFTQIRLAGEAVRCVPCRNKGRREINTTLKMHNAPTQKTIIVSTMSWTTMKWTQTQCNSCSWMRIRWIVVLFDASWPHSVSDGKHIIFMQDFSDHVSDSMASNELTVRWVLGNHLSWYLTKQSSTIAYIAFSAAKLCWWFRAVNNGRRDDFSIMLCTCLCAIWIRCSERREKCDAQLKWRAMFNGAHLTLFDAGHIEFVSNRKTTRVRWIISIWCINWIFQYRPPNFSVFTWYSLLIDSTLTPVFFFFSCTDNVRFDFNYEIHARILTFHSKSTTPSVHHVSWFANMANLRKNKIMSLHSFTSLLKCVRVSTSFNWKCRFKRGSRRSNLNHCGECVYVCVLIPSMRNVTLDFHQQVLSTVMTRVTYRWLTFAIHPCKFSLTLALFILNQDEK